MPTRRTVLARARHALDDFAICELFTLQGPLIAGGVGWHAWPTQGSRDYHPPHDRDVEAIADAWATREVELVTLWISGWQPESKWCGDFASGKPRTRPPGWWKHCAPERRRRGESQARYLTLSLS